MPAPVRIRTDLSACELCRLAARTPGGPADRVQPGPQCPPPARAGRPLAGRGSATAARSQALSGQQALRATVRPTRLAQSLLVVEAAKEVSHPDTLQARLRCLELDFQEEFMLRVDAGAKFRVQTGASDKCEQCASHDVR